MAIPCPDTQPHRAHVADNAHGICGGVAKPEDRARAAEMVLAAFDAAYRACPHAWWVPCQLCLVDALLDLQVFEPVLFPEESQ